MPCYLCLTHSRSLKLILRFDSRIPLNYTQCTVKLRPNFQKIAKRKCKTSKKRNLSERNLRVAPLLATNPTDAKLF